MCILRAVCRGTGNEMAGEIAASRRVSQLGCEGVRHSRPADAPVNDVLDQRFFRRNAFPVIETIRKTRFY
jgi:hypothetical protein